MRILLVEDNPEQQLIIKNTLRKGSFNDLTLASSANEAFNFLGIDNPEHIPATDLILMDIVMPYVDGIEACRKIKTTPHTSDIPIIMVTGLSQLENLDRAFDAGAMDYIVKPVKRIDLLARVQSALKLKQEMDMRKAREQDLIEEIEHRKQIKRAREKLILELKEALAQVKTLSGLLPICSNCKKIRDDKGYWNQIESYLSNHSAVDFSHSICPDCLTDMYPDYTAVKERRKKKADPEEE